jgi:hypothetical protein
MRSGGRTILGGYRKNPFSIRKRQRRTRPDTPGSERVQVDGALELARASLDLYPFLAGFAIAPFSAGRNHRLSTRETVTAGVPLLFSFCGSSVSIAIAHRFRDGYRHRRAKGMGPDSPGSDTDHRGFEMWVELLQAESVHRQPPAD